MKTADVRMKNRRNRKEDTVHGNFRYQMQETFVDARFKDGVLKLELPLKESETRRKIEIKSQLV